MADFKKITLKFALWVSTIIFVAPITQANAGENCTCRANGKDYKEGQVICLRLPSGPQLSRCESVLNNTSWKKMGDGCPSATLYQDTQQNNANMSIWVKTSPPHKQNS